MSKSTLWIVSPTFFDVSSFIRIRGEISALSDITSHFEFKFVVIDDSGGQDPAIAMLANLSDVQVIAPPYNLGHQGALVYGLRTLSSQIEKEDYVVTIDSDGEDKPDDLPKLIFPLQKESSNIHQVSIARRTHRSETIVFKLFYLCFKIAFRLATGTVIRNGNFAAFRGWFLKEVIFHPHFDQSYSSSFISLPLQIAFVPLARGKRYEGKSKMGYMGLFTHGIRMFMPFSEKIATRGILASGLVLVASAVCMNRFFLLLGTLLLGIFVILFTTFSQTKARSLRGLHLK